MKKQIQLFKPIFDIDRTLDEIKKCLELGWTGMGYKTIEFENEWKSYSDQEYNLFLNSATAGLNLALESFKRLYSWSSDSEVITTGLTFVSTNHSILLAGFIPVFCDVDETLTLDPIKFEELITSNTKAAIFVGLGGNVGNISEISRICKERNIKLVLDAAHMAGTRFDSKLYVSSFADVSVYSFQAVKNLPTADSGMLSTNDESLYNMSKTLSWLGIDLDTYERSKGGYKWKYNVNELGYKYNGNSIMASIAIVQLRKLDSDNKRRREIVEFYMNELYRLSPEFISFPRFVNPEYSSYHLFQLISEDRDELVNFLGEKGINVGVHYIDNTFYSLYSDFKRNNYNSRILSSKLISLPLHLELSKDDLEYIVKVIKEFYRNNAKD
jgi:dTDP-4-amino-4,6-dideoxygalactose transaminase